MNPVTYARYLDGSSTTALTKRLDVSRQYLSRLEQGLYDKPSAKLMNWVTDVLNKSLDKPVTPEMVEQLYREWQWQERESVKLNKALRPVTVTEYHRVSQPSFREHGVLYYHQVFVQWRGDYWNTSHAFCVDLRLHPSPVAEYEEGLTHTMPNQLKKVLRELHLIGDGFKTNER
jgi:transcriptional regulator with XRE-family HTH domain